MVPVNASGVPQPLTLEPPIPGFTVFKAVVIANGTGSVAQLQGVGDMGVDTPALVPLTQELYSFTNVRGAIQVTWETAGPVPTVPYLVATFSDDPDVDFAGKVYPAALSPMIMVAVSDLYNPVPIETTGGSGGVGTLINYATYQSAALGGNPVNDWDLVQGDFAYSGGTDIAFPDDSVSLVVVTYNCEAGSPAITSLNLLLRTSGDGQIDAVGFDEDGSTMFTQLSGEVSAIADTASSAYAFPWNVAAASSNGQNLTMKILSWAHP